MRRGAPAGGAVSDVARRVIAGCALLFCGLGATVSPAQPANDPTPPSVVVTVARDGYSIAGLVTVRPGVTAPKYGIALFPGHPGIMQLKDDAGTPRFDLGGNFLVRSRRHWLDDETLVVAVDAPSDQWINFFQTFRETPRYGADVAALLAEVARRWGGITDWTFVGTSEGSVSAWHAARMNPQLARRTILSASVMRRTRNGPGLSGIRWADARAPLLWVHHEDDPCPATNYADARRAAEAARAPLVTVRGGGPPRGADCQAFTAHGFVGIEPATVRAMHAWVKTGVAPDVVQP
jgi:hypothetical protein